MRIYIATQLIATTVLWSLGAAEAQTVSRVFKRVSPSVVVIQTKQHEAADRPGGQPPIG